MAQATELDDRIAKCNKILDENPNSQIFAALAEAYRKKGEVDKAFRICQSGLKSHPDYGSAHIVMAKINLDKGLYDWAEIEANRSIELDGQNRATEVLLAEIYIYRGEFAKAVTILNRINAEDPNNVKIKELLDLAKKLPTQSPAQSRIMRGKPPQDQNGGPQAKPADKGEKQKEEKPQEVVKVTCEELFNAIMSIIGVEGVMIANREGLVAESKWNVTVTAEEYGAVTIEWKNMIEEQIKALNFGKCQNLLVEAKGYIVNMLVMNEDYSLVIKANNKVNFGSLRAKLMPMLERLDYNF